MQYADEIKRAIVMGTVEEIDIRHIISVLTECDDLYHNDNESPLSDAEYDALRQYAERTLPTDPYFTGIGSNVRGGKIKLPHTMGSLDQIYQGDYARWVAKHAISKEEGIASDKLDGVSAMLVYGRDGGLQIAYSRGDGTMGADITRHVKKIHNVPQSINTNGEVITIRAEIILQPTRFKDLLDKVKSRSGKPYKNPRNMVAGCMNASDNPEIVYDNIDLVAYQIIGSEIDKFAQFQQLKELGFDVAFHSKFVFKEMVEDDLTVYLNDRRERSIYEIDGIVIDVNKAEVRARINPTKDTLNPAYAVKYKVADASNLADTEVLQVEWNISKDGYYKPRVQFKAIDLVGVTITNATGFNAKYILDNGIGPGAIIKITRSGDVIPFILEVVQPSPTGADMPDDDDAVWTETGVDLVVGDITSNQTVMFERLNDFFSTLEVPHLGEGNLQKIFDCDFRTPESIMSLTQEDFGSLVGSLAIGRKIFLGMKEKLTNLPMYKLMGAHPAFGRGVGVRKMKKLYDAFSGDMSKCQDFNAIVAVEGFEAKTAKKIVAGYAPFMSFFSEIEEYVTIEEYVAPKEGKLTGCVFVFTGFRSKELEAKVEAAGGKMGSAVSSKTTYLVADNPDSTSGKAQKARDVGIKVIGVPELQAMLA